MSLTQSPGPLAGQPGPTNYEIDGPQHRLLATPLPRRIRAELGGEVVLDTEGAIFVHETGLKPALYVPLADVRDGALERTDHTTHCPFKGDASYRTITVGDGVAENALWVYDAPLQDAAWLEGYAGVYLDRLDRWYDEDEEVLGFPDPYHRVDVRRTSRRVEVRAQGELVVVSERALLLAETALANRFYVPREDVSAKLHGPTDTTSWCPYKGTATYWNLELADGTVLTDAVWSYETPYPESQPVQGLVSFWGDDVVVSVTSV
ncbi:MAG: hypothetical protein JWR63_1841 [Conexibacter sp.]|jgi:uncharacterized protein (DUF427 family)|nr:hypothetical protein [Conexibacter sp.]